jgi:MerR family transcriptional regulator/heat shock protein HspR
MPDRTIPLYTIGIAAELMDVHPRTLRLYEESGLLKPARRNNRRFYSDHDLMWVRCIRYLIHDRGLNQEGLRRLLALIPCWEIQQCPPEKGASCLARQERSAPCWHLKNTFKDDNGCQSCPVYLSAPEHVCSPEELAELNHYPVRHPA